MIKNCFEYFVSVISFVMVCGLLQAAPLELSEVRIVAESTVAGIDSLRDTDQWTAAGLHLREQGAQTDLSYRGSAFSESGLALAGIALRHPQTGHFHAELPFPHWIFDIPRVTGGTENMLEGVGHAAATVRLRFNSIDESRKLMTGGAGQDRWYWGDFGLVKSVHGDNASGGSAVFGGYETMDSVDFRDNDMERFYGGFRGQRRTTSARTDIAAGYSEKKFGARGYYGVNPEWFAEERFEDIMAVLSHKEELAQTTAGFSAIIRETEDTYKLFTPSLYVNNHRARMAAGTAEVNTDISSVWSMHVRGSAEAETLDSERLGDHNRSRAAVMLAPTWHYNEQLQFTAGAEYQIYRNQSPALVPVMHAKLELKSGTILFAGFSEQKRLPSFTELNYESPGSLGNSGLRRGTIVAYEGGIMQQISQSLQTEVTVFERSARHTVDWIKLNAEDERWVASDIGWVVTRGAEARLSTACNKALRLNLMYTWQEKDADIVPYAARYVLDYPRHLIHAGIEWHLPANIKISSMQMLQVREPIDSRTEKTGVDGTLRAAWTPAKLPQIEIAFICNNMWDDALEEYVGQPVPQRRWGFELRTDL